MDIEITPVNPSEIDKLATLGRTTFYEAFHHLNNPDDLEIYLDTAFAKAQLSKELARPESHFFFVRAGHQIIGYLKLNTGTAQNEWQEANGMELERIYVIQKWQGKGIGKLLLDFAENCARDLDKSYLWLGVWEHNPNAIRLYIRAGYRTVDTHIYTIGNDPQTDFLMRKDLTYDRTD